jgi:lysozyme family protein
MASPSTMFGCTSIRTTIARDVRNLTLDQAKVIYRTKYWAKVKGDQLPPGVDYAVFDYGVNSGVVRAARVLQRIVGVEQDGKIGPTTLVAMANKNLEDLLRLSRLSLSS